MPRLSSIEEAGFKKAFTLFLRPKLTHSLSVPSLVGSRVHEDSRCRIVDAIVNRVLPREVAQAVKIPTTFDSTEWARECRQEAASEQVRCISALRGELSHVHDWKPS